MASEQHLPYVGHEAKIKMLAYCILDMRNAEPEVVCKDVVYHLKNGPDAYRRNETEAAVLLEDAAVLLRIGINKMREASRLIEISQEERDFAVAEYERTLGGR